MNDNLFSGRLVRLSAFDLEIYPKTLSRWMRDSETWRLQDSYPPHPITSRQIKEGKEKYLDKQRLDEIPFAIHTLADDRLIGDIGLGGIRWNHGDAFVGIGIGERELWGKGFGSDAMWVLLRYAFMELNLHRVSLTVFEYNPRAIRSYEKCGFQVEGRNRKLLNRAGRRWDEIYMGILREEWQQRNPPVASGPPN